MKYIKKFSSHNDYAAFIVGADFVTPNVSLCDLENELHFNRVQSVLTSFSPLDILYSDANGNLSVSNEILSVSEGKIPIALCVVGTDFFGDNEPARWISLKYMNYTTPETGSLTAQPMYFGNMGYLTQYQKQIENKTHTDGTNYGYFTDYNPESSTPIVPSLFDINNEWNLSVLGTINTYATTDIIGKTNTSVILQATSEQATWQTDSTITNNLDYGYAPAACCCARYHTLGTQPGDWYLGAAGEMSMVLTQYLSINTKLIEISEVYSSDCINGLSIGNDTYGYYQTSTEKIDDFYGRGSTSSWCIDCKYGMIGTYTKTDPYTVIAMLQY